MKRLIAILLCAVSTAWSSTEYLRPTADANQAVASVCGLGGYSDIASTSMSAVYSGKSGVGPTGSSAVLSLSAGTTDRFTSRTFSGFPNSSHTYTASPILYVSAACATFSTAACIVYYSVNSGSSWTQLYRRNYYDIADNLHGNSFNADRTDFIVVAGCGMCRSGHSNGDSIQHSI